MYTVTQLAKTLLRTYLPMMTVLPLKNQEMYVFDFLFVCYCSLC
jgi:hypothetical protein